MRMKIVIDMDIPGTQSMDTVMGIQAAVSATVEQLCGPQDKWKVVVTSGEEDGNQEHCFVCGGCVMKGHDHPGMCSCVENCSHPMWEWKGGMQRFCSICDDELPPEIDMTKLHNPHVMSCGDKDCPQCRHMED